MNQRAKRRVRRYFQRGGKRKYGMPNFMKMLDCSKPWVIHTFQDKRYRRDLRRRVIRINGQPEELDFFYTFFGSNKSEDDGE